MAKKIAANNTLHLRKDPNDPRNLKPAGALPSLNEVPEAPVAEVEVKHIEGDNYTQHIGVDPNDPRL